MAVQHNRVINTLIEKGIIEEELVRSALTELKKENEKLTIDQFLEHLVGNHNIGRHELYSIVSRMYAFREIEFQVKDLDENQISWMREVFFSYSEEIQEKLKEARILPFKPHELNQTITVFVSPTPFTKDFDEYIRQNDQVSQYEIVYSRQEVIDELIAKICYTENEFLKDLEGEIESVDVSDDENSVDESALDAEINRSSLTKMIEASLVEGVRMGASDLHYIPKTGNVTEISFRVDGKLHVWHRVENIKPEALAAVIKDRASNIDRFDRSIAQDGFIQRSIDGAYIRFRVSVIPIVSGEFSRRMESVVIRILDDRKVIVDIAKLGLQEKALQDFITSISQPQGMIMLTGPTGSGKSTTLVAALNHVKDSTKNILTVEEPVEYLIEGARQIRLSPKLTFEGALRAILRHDPDIVMVGEMRDLKSASIGISLANTGHLTLSSLHTNNAPAAFARLYMLGVETFLLANAINLIMAQRLVRKLCQHCKAPIDDSDRDMAYQIGLTDEEMKNNVIYKAVGCDQCHHGYKGRTAIVEALLMNKEIRDIILSARDSIDEDAIRESAVRNGMLTLRDSGRHRVLEGITTIQEIVAATSEL